ncbi:hypothetical protein RHGRI_000717 [Rhododendron griersonianum]|uniref:Sodium/pyruvate cotransporter BASS2, chloroplastic n=1 Tax=Rhododendron griersonianum TaxID=479676 RepID=A0AAV6LIU4_9ERIC|nr:hypothetical protein RHGRI_000717 [Rhododendron griersonianum]
MASMFRFIAKDCRLQPCDAVYRPSICLSSRRLQTQLDFRGTFGLPENGKGCLAIHTKPMNSTIALSAPTSMLQPSRHSQVVCKAATNASGDIPGSASTGMTQYERIIELLTTLFPVWVILGTIIGIYKPSAVTWLQTDLFTVGLGFLMLSMGLTLTFEDFRRCLRNPWTVGVGFLAQYLIKPMLGFFIALTLKLSAPLATGLILVSCCPGGQASNVATYISKGNVALSVLMTTCSTIGAIIMTPLLTKLLAGQLVPVDAAGLAMSTFQVVLLPTIVGVLANEFFPKFTGKIITVTPLIGVILTTLLCASPIGQVADVLKTQGAQLLLPVALLHGAAFAIGYWISKLSFGESTSRTISIECGMQSSALGFLLAQKHFTNPLVAVPSAKLLSLLRHNKGLGSSCAVRRVDRCGVWTSPSKPALLPHAEDFHTLPSSAASKCRRSLQSVWTSPSKSALLPHAEDFHTLPSSAASKNRSLQSGNPYGAARSKDGIVATCASHLSYLKVKELNATLTVKVLDTKATHEGVLLDADFRSNLAFIKIMSPGQQKVARFAELDQLHPGMAVGCTGWRRGLAYADSLYCPTFMGSVANETENKQPDHARASGQVINAEVEGCEGSFIGGPLVNPFVGVAGVIHYEESRRIKATPIYEVLKRLERFEEHGEQLKRA